MKLKWTQKLYFVSTSILLVAYNNCAQDLPTVRTDQKSTLSSNDSFSGGSYIPSNPLPLVIPGAQELKLKQATCMA